ncbi:MAG: aminoacyl-tRNA hydrolase [Provencibacterium sp.]|nr:aminoacyl-tRNA hydrolase [Provencibacterium sp.]
MKEFFSEYQPAGPIEYMVVGLGNPGPKYEGTRHNAGFMALDLLAGKTGARVDKLKFRASLGDCMICGKRTLLLKPSTFMNNSGEAVRDAMQFYKLPPERVLILLDDISLPVGRLRIRRKGSDGGQNGMKNIIYLSGSDQFPRIKIGIGNKPHPDYDLAAWVLSRFTEQERAPLSEALAHAAEAVPLIVSGEIDEAMNRFNH